MPKRQKLLKTVSQNQIFCLFLLKKFNKISEAIEEIKTLKNELENQKTSHQTSQDVLQEMIDNLTQTKLENATKLDELSKQISSKDVSLKQIQSKSDEVAIENEALKRQNQRITEENESLLLKLDEKSSNEEIDKSSDELTSLRKQYEEKCEEVASMKNLIDNNSNKIKRLIQENSDLKASIESSNSPVDEVKVKYDVVVKKLKVYREKLIAIYEQAKLFKAEKKMLLSMTKEYGQSVASWQKDIANASTRLIIQLKELKGEIKEKDEEIERLKKSNESSSENVRNFSLRVK